MSKVTTNIESKEKDLYETLINDKRFKSDHWDHVSLVFSESGTAFFGYRFFDGGWSGFGPDNFDWASPAQNLYGTMEAVGKPWIKMLMTLNKEKNSYTVEYEYEDESRWKLGGKDMSSIEEFAYSLKRD